MHWIFDILFIIIAFALSILFYFLACLHSVGKEIKKIKLQFNEKDTEKPSSFKE